MHGEGMHLIYFLPKLFEVKIGWRGLKTGMKRLTAGFEWDDERLADQLANATAIRLKIKGIRKSDGKYQYRQLKESLDAFWQFLDDRLEENTVKRLEILISLSGVPFGLVPGMEMADEEEVKGLLRPFGLLRELEQVSIQIKGGKAYELHQDLTPILISPQDNHFKHAQNSRITWILQP
jgi:hypothetical protein